jgi:hypothetical protein
VPDNPVDDITDARNAGCHKRDLSEDHACPDADASNEDSDESMRRDTHAQPRDGQDVLSGITPAPSRFFGPTWIAATAHPQTPPDGILSSASSSQTI